MISKAAQQASLKRLDSLAQKHGGKLLEERWLGLNTLHRFVDADGYAFTRSPQTLRLAGWPKNNRRLLTPQERHKELSVEATKLGFSILEEAWLGRHTPHRFSDPLGAAVLLKPDFFLSQGGSRKMRATPEKHLDEIRAACQKRGGRLISAQWAGALHLYDIEDENGTRHKMAGSKLKGGSWPRSNGLTSEPLCRQAIEHLFGKLFPKNTSLLAPSLTGGVKAWELDGYCEELRVAFEYQGHSGHWDPVSPSYGATSARDRLKADLCRSLGVLLVPIERLPEVKNKWHPEFVLEHVLQSVSRAYGKAGLRVPSLNVTPYQQDMESIGHLKMMRKKMDALAKANGGRFLDKEWRGSAKPHLFSFSDGREFWANPHNLQRQGWPQDATSYLYRYQASPEDRLGRLRAAAASHGYCLVETVWMGSKHRYHFADAEGLEFSVPYSTLKAGWPRAHSQESFKP